MLQESLVQLGVEEPGVRVPVHEGEDLQLGLVEGVGSGLHHVAVDYLSYTGV